jgi:predicted metal-dependent enzyme (double-stranded beta helix superfamily)
MFDLDTFLDSCIGAADESEPRRVVTDLLRRTMETPRHVADALATASPGINVLHGSPDLTVLNVVWAPRMQLPPHDHRMWAAIGIYTGREDNALFRRSAPAALTIDESGSRELDEGDVLALGRDAIHSVTNPLDRITGAIHVYGGDFVNEPRSQWGPGERTERPYDLAYIRSLFDEASQARP